MADQGRAEMIGKRVVMTGDHPWRGEAGEVLDIARFDGAAVRVRLDNGQEVFAFEGQWRQAAR